MRILMAAPGGSMHTINQLNLLLDEKDVEVIFMDDFDPLPEGKTNYTFVNLPLFRRKRFLSRVLGYRFIYWTEGIILKYYLRNVIKIYSPDIFHVHWIDERILYLKQAGAKTVVASAWGTDINQHFISGTNPYLKDLKGKCLVAADSIIIDSDIIDERCEILAGIPLIINSLHIGINTELFKPGYQAHVIKMKEQLAINDDYKIILSARGWQDYYNQMLILEAFAEVLKTFPKTILIFKLHNCLKVKKSVDKIRAKVDKLKINDNVRWLEDVPMEELPVVYNMSDLIVNCPSMDTLPITFMEAAACCRPVVSCKLPTYMGTFAEKYFSLVNEPSINNFASAIENCLAESDSSDLTEARKFIINNYDQMYYIRNIMDIYRKMITKNKESIL